MNSAYYLLDNNALARIGSAGRSSRFVCERDASGTHRCRISSEVLYEARFFSEHPTLQPLELRTTPAVLRHLKEVMATERPGALDLVDLYQNTGAADPLLIAHALHQQRLAADTLFREEWIIVTADDALARRAAAFGVPTVGPHDFQRIAMR